MKTQTKSFRMKLFVALELLWIAKGFVVPCRVHRFGNSWQALQESTTVSDFGSDFGSAMPEEVSAYERIGITEDQLALGINPEEVISYIGT